MKDAYRPTLPAEVRPLVEAIAKTERRTPGDQLAHMAEVVARNSADDTVRAAYAAYKGAK